MTWNCKRFVAISLTVSLIALSGREASAMLAPAQAPGSVESIDRTADLKTIQTALERKEVREHLSRLGLTDNEIQSRLASLTDSELHTVATQIERELPAGDSVVTILVIGILVLLFVYLLKRV